MVYATPEAICDILGAKDGEERKNCVNPLRDFETVTETLLDYKEKDFRKALDSKPVTAVIWAQPDCPFCEEEVQAMVQVMGKVPEFGAFAVDCNEPGWDKRADEEKVVKTPTISFYRKGETSAALVLEGRRSPADVEAVVRRLLDGETTHPKGDGEQACPRDAGMAELAKCFQQAALSNI